MGFYCILAPVSAREQARMKGARGDYGGNGRQAGKKGGGRGP